MNDNKPLKFYEKPAFNIGCLIVAILTIYLYYGFINKSQLEKNEQILRETMIKCLKGEIPTEPIKDAYGRNLDYFERLDTKKVNFVIISSGPSKSMDYTLDNVVAECFMDDKDSLIIYIGGSRELFLAKKLSIEDLGLTHDQLKY